MAEGGRGSAWNEARFDGVTGERDGTGEQVGELGFIRVSRWLAAVAGVVVLLLPQLSTIPLFNGGEGEPEPPESRQEIPEVTLISIFFLIF